MIQTKETPDLYLASALSALGARYEGADKTDPKHIIFKFSLEKSDPVQEPIKTLISPPRDLDEWENSWANGTLLVNACDYAEAIKRFKGIVHTK